MSPFKLSLQEISHRRISSLLTVLLLAAITGTMTFFAVNTQGYEKEIGRNVRDIGSNVVILPADVDQFAYHQEGGFTSATMPDSVVQQLIEFRASLNHLIPMLERRAECSVGDKRVSARIVGLSASIPVPGRPKAPMQKAIQSGKIQIGAALAKRLGIERDRLPTGLSINGTDFPIERVNRENGTWQDSTVFMELEKAQALFDLRGQISRVEAIECTQQKCEATGLQSDVVLANELAQITDQAILLRRDQIATARLNVRALSRQNLNLLKNLLWVFLVVSMIGLAVLNTLQRQSEIGVLQAVGFGQLKVTILFVLRSFLLGLAGSCLGVAVGAYLALWQSRELFAATGRKLSVDWNVGLMIGGVAIGLSVMATLLPAFWSATRHPANLIGKEY